MQIGTLRNINTHVTSHFLIMLLFFVYFHNSLPYNQLLASLKVDSHGNTFLLPPKQVRWIVGDMFAQILIHSIFLIKYGVQVIRDFVKISGDEMEVRENVDSCLLQ